LTHYLFDTNHASLLYRLDPKMVAVFQQHHADRFHLCTPSLAELWYMVHNSARRQQNIAELKRFVDRFYILDFKDVHAQEYGIIKSELRRLGKPIPDVDIQIAAVARVTKFVLLTDDAHFTPISGITIENWLRP
jgi:tRNA(fMet)-specific endonuclease VapC